jgi:(1->4)-alpha-D-glucan 1-alpha-D-glucosylmutase
VSPRSAIPTATYRLQLHKGFTFAEAEACVPYLARLGISHLYLSPILTARAGSTHGYDGIDPTTINPELGGEAGFRRLAATAKAAGLGLILDIVPNHLAVWQADNRLWRDVLENGPASAHARTFDIDFESPEPGLAGKVLAPILGKPYGLALADGDVALIWDEALGKLAFAYGPHRLPLRPQDYAEVAAGQPPAHADLQDWNDPDRLHSLLERQNFRLAHWTAARDAINWRRFFDINELAGLRVEDTDVFALVHGRIFQLYAEGLIDGVRVDHVDGLSEPAAYTRALRRQLTALTPQRPPDAPADGPWIVVEKILGADEAMPSDWEVDGTTGYDFMDQVSALQHDPAGEADLDDLWRAQGGTESFEAAETQARTEILQDAFAAQLAQAARAFADLARLDPATRDLNAEAFRRALQALIERLRVYRSYATGRADADAGAPMRDALARTQRERPTEAAALVFIAQTLAGDGPGSEAARVEATRRLNQLTAPVAAKAVEDTAFYRYGRLLSRNDVGFQADRFSLDRAAFLATGAARAADWPQAMLTTATHDHKRGEDVRARLAVISELVPLWRAQVEAWNADLARRRPDRLRLQDDYHLYQTLVGAWPIGLRSDDGPGLADFHRRLAGWREKSLREAKLSTSWAAPDDAYEADSQAWLATLLDPEQSGSFLASAKTLVDRIAGPGAINGVTQAALRCAWPGVPDLYQGAELWDLSLVDPDNRRPVDFPHRERLLDAGVDDWLSGGIKLAAITTLLRRRHEDPELFQQGALAPVPVRGRRQAHIVAFTRSLDDRQAAIGIMLHVADAVTRLGDLPTAAWWADTEVHVGAVWRPAAALFSASPVFAETVNGSGPKMRTEGRSAR